MITRTEKLAVGSLAEQALARMQRKVRDWAINEALKYRLSRERRELAGLSDAQLRDIGVSRGDAQAEASRTDIPAARMTRASRR